MLTRDEVVEKIRANYGELQEFGVRSISVYGSVARGEAGPASDVDLLVDLEPDVTLFGFIRLRRRLRELLGTEVDLTTEDGLHERVRETVLAEAVRAA